MILAKFVSDIKYAYMVASAPFLHKAVEMTARGKKLKCEKKAPQTTLVIKNIFVSTTMRFVRNRFRTTISRTQHSVVAVTTTMT